MKHPFVVFVADESVVATTIMGGSAPTHEAVGWWPYWETKFSFKCQQEEIVIEAMGWDTVAHSDEGKGSGGNKDAWQVMVVVFVNCEVEFLTDAFATVSTMVFGSTAATV